MAVLTPVLGNPRIELVKRLAEACGVSIPFERLVIEMDVNKPIRVYVKAPLDVKVVEKITEAMEVYRCDSATVGDDTEVHVVKSKETTNG